MGNWHISIRGLEPHHNGKDFDADEIAKKFIKELEDKGQQLKEASITYGGAEDIYPSTKS